MIFYRLDVGGTSTDVSRFDGRHEPVYETTTAGLTIRSTDGHQHCRGMRRGRPFLPQRIVTGRPRKRRRRAWACLLQVRDLSLFSPLYFMHVGTTRKGGPLAITRLVPDQFPKRISVDLRKNLWTLKRIARRLKSSRKKTTQV